MKILHIMSGDLGGGAARGAYWLHRALVELGVDSKVLTNAGTTFGDPTVESVGTSKKGKFYDVIRSEVDNLPSRFYSSKSRLNFSSSIVGYNFIDHRLYRWADIIHLHWINNGFVSIRHLSKVKKKIVWTLRDMWPMTGGCHYSMDCELYKSGCGTCPVLGSRYRYDLSFYVAKLKQRCFDKKMKIIGISDWISTMARDSAIFREFDVCTIENNINAIDFHPVNKTLAKEMMGIVTDKKVILVGAQDLNDHYKGFHKYLEAVQKLDKTKYFLIFFGKVDAGLMKSLGFEYKSFGFLHDSVALRLAYSAAEVFVAPSLMDAFGKTIAESMACGTPVVCFDFSGPKEIVDHKINGYKALPFEADDLATGIEWILGANNYSDLSENASSKALCKFDSKVIANKYIKLYREIQSAQMD